MAESSENKKTKIISAVKKNYSKEDLVKILPKTKNQELLFEAWKNGDNLAPIGCAGTGKTFIASFLACSDLLNKDKFIRNIKIVRSTVQGREQGFLPGTPEEKQMEFEMPYFSIFEELFNRKNAYQELKEKEMVEFVSTSFLRGVTWHNSIVIIDECQNMTFKELDSIMTRIGDNSKIIMCGDTKSQCDLRKEHTGIHDTLNVLKNMQKAMTVVEFTSDDCVRSEFVKAWLKTREALNI